MRNEQIKIQVEGSGKNVCLETYILGDVMDGARNRKTPLVLICPGGGYAMTSNREAEPIALQFNSMGYQAAVLRYSCAPAVYPTALCELAQSVKLIREHAEEWSVNAEKIIVMGFSAGGHLAASYGVFWNEPWLAEKTQCDKKLLEPNGLVLCYPVISSKEEIAHQDSIKNLLGESYPEMKEQVSLEDKVGKHTPKTFLWHTFTDPVVPFWNSFRFAEALGKAGVPMEYHLYPQGGHGLSLANEQTANEEGKGVEKVCQSWVPLLRSWMLENFGLYS
ncbi:MAG: alpha/beta hydrolase [Blautia hansenii]|nr:alpha/beta hydrolase [Blautia hansenii]MEE0655268.1 alpha/beta hydrolase [Blautia hansenii]